MRKLIFVVVSLLLSVLSFSQSTVTQLVDYNGAQANGCCNVCGNDYWCINNLGGCGTTAGCDVRTFPDPVPPGNVVTAVTIQYWTADCYGHSITGTIDGNTVATVNEGNTGCYCSTNPCGISASSSGNYPCGMPGYVYGGNNTIQLCTGTDVCVDKVYLVITYVTPAQINPTITASGPTNFCQGGSVILNAGAGYSAYSWNTGANTQTINVSTSGTYVVTVTSITGCTSGSASITVNVNANPSPSITASGPINFCQGGSVILNAGAGYTNYSWTTGANTQTISVSTSGTYGVTVTNGSGCTGTANINVTANPTPSVSASSTQTGCTIANGTATANPSGGTPGYTYAWSPSGGNAQTANNLSAGTYNVTVTDANGCTAITSVNVTTASGPSVNASGTQSGCTVANGTATANPSGGTPGYTYLWSPSGQNTQTATGLAAGNYNVTITDANGCTAQTSVTIISTNGPTVTASATPGGCTAANGTATANPSGGTPGYTYIWNPSGQTTQIATGLSTGNYNVTVTDANGCIAQTSVTISSTGAPTVTASSTPGGCTVANGTATANPSGGTPGYTYLWSPSGQNTQTATGLAPATYTVLITDANGCTAVSTTSIPITAGPTISAAAVGNVSCNGGNNGSASASPSGGTAPFTYSWSTLPVQTSQNATGLSSGNYNVTVTDANGCTALATVSINQPTLLTAAATATAVTCNGGNNGSANATPSGGTPGYNYSWSPSGGNAQTATNLIPGTYSITITDAHGCQKITTVTITQPPPITLSVSGKDSVCAGGNTTLSANVIGGTPLYTYLWNPGPQSGSSVVVNPTSSTNYSVAITDANGCVSLTQTFNVLVLAAPNALFDTVSSGGFGSTYSFSDLSTPTVSVTAWSWDFGDNTSGSNQQNPVHTFPGSGTYTVTEVIFNKAGCPDTFKVVINISEGIIIPNVFTPDGDGVNDVWYIPNSGMKEFQVTIFDRWGAKVFETTADEIRWDGHSTSGHLLSDGTYYYVLKAILKSGGGEKDYSTHGYVTLLTNKK